MKSTYNTLSEAQNAFRSHLPFLEERGLSWAGAPPISYLPENFRQNPALAMDALPTLSTDPNSSVPAMLTTLIDPTVIEVLFSPVKAAEIYGEVRKGTWLDETAMFPIAEHTGEVSSYGDFNANGRAGANTNWPQRQAYLYQTTKEYGERELERAGLARINWVSELDKAAAGVLMRFANVCYFFGVQGLQNYGWLNDPNLSASLTPGSKTAGGTAWIVSGRVNAQANEIYSDVETIYYQLVSQTGGLVAQDTEMTLSMAPTSAVALTATNTFNVNVSDLLKKNFPNMKIETAVQYGVVSSTNPYGIAAGNMVQLAAHNLEGQQTGYCAYNEKQRAHAIIKHESSFRRKVSSGVWGAVIRMPFALASMVGV